MIRNLKNIIKKILQRLNNRNHKINYTSTYDNNNYLYNLNHILDLEQNFKLESKKTKLISFLGNKNEKILNDYPVIESFLKQNGKTFAIEEVWRSAQNNKINQETKKQTIFIEEEIYLLPYYTSHFGHFTGDVLGSMIFFLKKLKYDKSKLLVLTPSKYWDDFFIKNFKDSVIIKTPLEMVTYNFEFKNSYVLPRFSTFQNIVCARNYFLSKSNSKPKIEKLFITSFRESRISNISELTDFLLKENFEIINPENLNIEDLSNKIRNSEILISEKASVYNNNLLFRDRPFFLLSSKNEINLEKKFFIGAGIYKTFLNGIINEIFFEDDPEFQNEKPFKKRIKVDLKILTKVLNDKKKN